MIYWKKPHVTWDQKVVQMGKIMPFFTTHDCEWFLHTTYKHGDDWGMVCANGIGNYPHFFPF